MQLKCLSYKQHDLTFPYLLSTSVSNDLTKSCALKLLRRHKNRRRVSADSEGIPSGPDKSSPLIFPALTRQLSCHTVHISIKHICGYHIQIYVGCALSSKSRLRNIVLHIRATAYNSSFHETKI